MIECGLSEGYAVLLIVQLGAMLGVTLYYGIRQYRWVPRRHSAPSIFRCAVCGHVYLEHRNVPMSECNKCGHMNEGVKGI